ncbi:serine/threonine-protein kinase RsbW [Thermoflexibacter ruber]|uniref:Serine/threonine-protein kinase RsbW n=2 Tax=Thermoflexibacter ruber TaxID=1003 RepID=A0A1I2GSL5_9BACT|nr:serine/threonine-protein kinase RsbW [Thermoflexibacter ruber]
MHSLQVPCTKENLKEIRYFVENALNRYEISTDDIYFIKLAIDEICANLIIHAHHCNHEDFIEVKIKNEGNTFIFEIHDQSNDNFNLLEYKVPDIQQIIANKKNGNMGLILVRKIMDEIELERCEGHNICRLYKSIPQANS